MGHTTNLYNQGMSKFHIKWALLAANRIPTEHILKCLLMLSTSEVIEDLLLSLTTYFIRSWDLGSIVTYCKIKVFFRNLRCFTWFKWFWLPPINSLIKKNTAFGIKNVYPCFWLKYTVHYKAQCIFLAFRFFFTNSFSNKWTIFCPLLDKPIDNVTDLRPTKTHFLVPHKKWLMNLTKFLYVSVSMQFFRLYSM